MEIIYTITCEGDGTHICFDSYRQYKDAEKAVEIMKEQDYKREGENKWKYFISVSFLH